MRRAALFALLLVATACGSSDDDEHADDEHAHEAPAAAFTEDEADTRAEVTLKDFQFVGLPPTVKGQKVHFTLVNVGAVQHEFLVIGGDGKEVAAASPFPTGNEKTLAVELGPGSYTVECRIMEGDKLHTELGMKATLSVS